MTKYALNPLSVDEDIFWTALDESNPYAWASKVKNVTFANHTDIILSAIEPETKIKTFLMADTGTTYGIIGQRMMDRLLVGLTALGHQCFL